jgi:hypothetical protein
MGERIAGLLKQEELEVLATGRHSWEMDAFIKNHGFRVQLLGRHGGGEPEAKLAASLERAQLLLKMVRKQGADLALSFGSPECARIAFGLKIPHIMVCDTPHAEAVARLTVPLSIQLLTPWVIPTSAWTRYGIDRGRVGHYRGLDPLVWLQDIPLRGRETHPPYVVVRLCESQAAYLQGVGEEWNLAVVEALLKALPSHRLVALPRYPEQADTLAQRFGDRVAIPAPGFTGTQILVGADIFVGLGGTMTAEAALMGIPTISAYPGNPYLVERFLAKEGLVQVARTLRQLVKTVRALAQDQALRQDLRERARTLRMRMEDPAPRIVEAVKELL